ncbi:MAG: hypothetical protein AAGJ08_00675 [Cyanobacteria bacterium P01_H01_bin.35]
MGSKKARPENIISLVLLEVRSARVWQFLKPEERTVIIDLTDYPLPPVEKILSFLVWMTNKKSKVKS